MVIGGSAEVKEKTKQKKDQKATPTNVNEMYKKL